MNLALEETEEEKSLREHHYNLQLIEEIGYWKRQVYDLQVRYDKLAKAYESKNKEPDPNIWDGA